MFNALLHIHRSTAEGQCHMRHQKNAKNCVKKQIPSQVRSFFFLVELSCVFFCGGYNKVVNFFLMFFFFYYFIIQVFYPTLLVKLLNLVNQNLFLILECTNKLLFVWRHFCVVNNHSVESYLWYLHCYDVQTSVFTLSLFQY